MEAFTTFLSGVWELFQSVTVPVLNITFAHMWLGIFVVGISISILRPLLGIGFGAVNNILSGLSGKRGYDRSYSKKAPRAQKEIMPNNPSNRDYPNYNVAGLLPEHKRKSFWRK